MKGVVFISLSTDWICHGWSQTQLHLALRKPPTDLFLLVVSVAMLFPFYLALHKLFFNIKFCLNVADSSVFEGRFALCILSFNISNNDIVAVMLHQLRAVIVILIKFLDLLQGEGKRSTSAELVK